MRQGWSFGAKGFAYTRATSPGRVAKETGAAEGATRRKDRRYVFDHERGGGTKGEDVPPEQASVPCLSPKRLHSLRVAALTIERAFAAPQDPGFAVEGNAPFRSFGVLFSPSGRLLSEWACCIITRRCSG